jgi:pimeloyl-ACP methyl ester carboxylesterase
MQPDTRYAKSGDVHIAYQVFGESPLNIVFAPPSFSNVEHWWDEPDVSRWLLRLASYARVVMFDKRGTGLSDRVELPGLDQRMDDLRAVMDAVGMEQAALLGISEGGTMSALFAATHPDRCRALVLCGAYAQHVPTPEAFARFLDYVDRSWGSGGSVARFAPSRANDLAFQRWWAKNERLGASPAGITAYARMNIQIDISDIVSTIRVPTLVIHRTDDRVVNVEARRFLAEHIPGAPLYRASGGGPSPLYRRQCRRDR